MEGAMPTPMVPTICEMTSIVSVRLWAWAARARLAGSASGVAVDEVIEAFTARG